MSALACWALLALFVIVGAAAWDCLCQAPHRVTREPLALWTQCPGASCARLLAPGERCPEHDAHAPLRTGAVR